MESSYQWKSHKDFCESQGWGVYEEHCTLCGGKVVIVATLASVEDGTAEAFQKPIVCMACKAAQNINPN